MSRWKALSLLFRPLPTKPLTWLPLVLLRLSPPPVRHYRPLHSLNLQGVWFRSFLDILSAAPLNSATPCPANDLCRRLPYYHCLMIVFILVSQLPLRALMIVFILVGQLPLQATSGVVRQMRTTRLRKAARNTKSTRQQTVLGVQATHKLRHSCRTVVTGALYHLSREFDCNKSASANIYLPPHDSYM